MNTEILDLQPPNSQALRTLLPKEAFAPNPRKLVWAVVHFSLIATSLMVLRNVHGIALSVGISFLIGHSLACLAFVAHELSHGSVLRSRAAVYPLELVMWGLNWIPPTLWRRVHNQSHHGHANTVQDPDRQFFSTEQTRSTRLYSFLFYPSKRTSPVNPLVALHFIPYIIRNLLVALLPVKKIVIVPFVPRYRLRDRLVIGFELLVILLLQYCLFATLGHNVVRYLWAGPIAVCFTSAVVMSYVFTNHYLNPICEKSDPLKGTTSVVVSPICDRLHQNFSYHTEHHLFPAMNSEFYPLLSRLLSEKFHGQYHRIPFRVAWQRLWKSAPFPEGARNAASDAEQARLTES